MTKTYFKRTEKRCSELTMTIQCLCVGLVIVHYAQTGNLAPSIFLLIKYSWPFRIYMCCCCFVLAHFVSMFKFIIKFGRPIYYR